MRLALTLRGDLALTTISLKCQIMTNDRCKRTLARALGVSLACLLSVAGAYSQAPAAGQKQLMSEDVFKNVQTLRGIPVDEFMGTMGFFAASLGLNCVDCHVGESLDNWARFADDTPRKQTARKMMLMVRSLNQSSFGGKPVVTCYTCHRGVNQPEGMPSLEEQYGTPPPDDPDQIQIRGAGAAGPSAEQILNRYIQAAGGAPQLAKLTSFTAKGTYAGFDTDGEKVPIELFAKAPNEFATIVHTRLGTNTATYDGQAAWVAAIIEPVPLLQLTGGQLEGAKVDAALYFPVGIKQEFKTWRAGFPEVTIGSHTLQVVQGTTASGFVVKFYFDKLSGLLFRQTRFLRTVVGVNPMHIEYGDYRVVAGVKMPFQWTTTWTDGQSTTQLTEVRPNVPIEDAKFGKPLPASPKSATP
jgi:hypothetical protein